MNIFKKLFINERKNMIKYMRKIGVNFDETDIEVANNVEFDSEPYLIFLAKGVKLSSGVRFVTHDGGVHVLRKIKNKPYDKFGKISVGENTFIGNNAAIMPGVSIGKNVINGYGSIVTKNVPDNEVWAGIPERKIETIEEYFNKNESKLLLTKNLS